ncbi:hypothetical protein Q5H92_25225 [Hymenobacter sp. M29]|uniref:DUF4145 domain-containing protein n=1 Tax=Hymenobacter mellowenesis TaxID=3063995 RepID=A0ABT9AIK5_9BACT|nr:hypothetical protein [Hymenobacter sp. M29]MDO7849690.1 hypothetical protein [Hymenobacter sp. M29]
MENSAQQPPKDKSVSKEEALFTLPQRITELVETESDRGSILILGAYIDEILGLLISAACVSDSLGDGILKHGHPAGTFDSRLLIAQAFGLIHDEDVKGLRIIQKIRNKAAHFDRSGRGFDVLFDSPATADQVVELSLLFYEKLTDRSSLAVRHSFVESARNVAQRLLLRRPDIKRPAPLKSTQELITTALSLNEDTPLVELIDKLRELKDSPEGKAMYQGFVHTISKMVLNSQTSADGNGLPDEMILAVSDMMSRPFNFPLGPDNDKEAGFDQSEDDSDQA